MVYKPFAYQSYAEDFIHSHNEAGLLLDMGLGKTVITLTVLNRLLYEDFSCNRVLIIAPLKVAEDTWPKEIEKWEHLQHMTYSVVLGSVQERKKALSRKADIYIINRENTAWLVNLFKTKWPFDLVVIDELSSFKSSKAQRFRELRKVRKYVKRIVGLTGTPAPKGLIDLWPQIYLLDEGRSLGKTITGYREQYFVPDKRNATTIFSWAPKSDAEEKIYAKLQDLCISMKAKDYLDLPERIDVRHTITLPASALSEYKQLEHDALLPFADGDIDAGSAAILWGKLVQFSSGAVYNENGIARVFHDVKLQALDDLIEAANGQPVLVAYYYKHEYERLTERYPYARSVKEPGVISRWNAGEVPLLLVHPASAGHGLNLQEGGHIIIWLSLPPGNLELYLQTNARLHRLGQKAPVLVHHVLADSTMDKVNLSVLQNRNADQNAFLEALRARISDFRQ